MDPQAPTPVPEKPSFPEPPRPKDNHWITIASMAVFVLLSLGAVAFLFYQNQQLKAMLASYQAQSSPIPSATPDSTANWKIYTNEKMNLTFKYPESLQTFSSQYNDYDVAINTAQYAPLYLEIAYLPNSNLQDWYEKAYKSARQDNPTPPALANGPTIDGSKSYQSDFNLEGFGKIRYIFIPVGKGLYQIHLPLAENEAQYQILSTFKFTDGNATGQFCGGIAGIACREGYDCKYDGDYPDAGGVCIKK